MNKFSDSKLFDMAKNFDKLLKKYFDILRNFNRIKNLGEKNKRGKM